MDPSVDESELRLAQLQHQLPSNEPGTLMQLLEDSNTNDDDDDEDPDTKECRTLFKSLKFFLSREVFFFFQLCHLLLSFQIYLQHELQWQILYFQISWPFNMFCIKQVPREALLFIIPAFGGVVSWEGEGAPFKETDEDIAYQVLFTTMW